MLSFRRQPIYRVLQKELYNGIPYCVESVTKIFPLYRHTNYPTLKILHVKKNYPRKRPRRPIGFFI
jgi:hypothetical protein